MGFVGQAGTLFFRENIEAGPMVLYVPSSTAEEPVAMSFEARVRWKIWRRASGSYAYAEWYQ